MAGIVYLVLKPFFNMGLCIPHESENHVNISPISILNVKEPQRTTSTLAVTPLNVSTERLVWGKCSEKN